MRSRTMIRITPRAPRPAGVAMATMVSSVANMTDGQVLILDGDDHGLHERIADAFRGDPGVLSNCKVHDPAFMRIQRPHFLRHPRRPSFAAMNSAI